MEPRDAGGLTDDARSWRLAESVPAPGAFATGVSALAIGSRDVSPRGELNQSHCAAHSSPGRTRRLGGGVAWADASMADAWPGGGKSRKF